MKKLVLLLCFTLFAFASSYNQKMLNLIKKSDLRQQSFSFAVMGDNRDGDNVILSPIVKTSF